MTEKGGCMSASAGSGATIIRLPIKDFTCLKSGFVHQDTPPFLQKENEGEEDVGPRANKIHRICAHLG